MRSEAWREATKKTQEDCAGALKEFQNYYAISRVLRRASAYNTATAATGQKKTSKTFWKLT
jgi:hypothetical protein